MKCFSLIESGAGVTRGLISSVRHAHLCHFLKYNRIMNRLRSILAPGERSVIRAEHCRYVYRIDASLLEGLNDDKAGILLVLAIDLFRSQASRTRNRSIHIICMCGPVARNVSAGLRP